METIAEGVVGGAPRSPETAQSDHLMDSKRLFEAIGESDPTVKGQLESLIARGEDLDDVQDEWEGNLLHAICGCDRLDMDLLRLAVQAGVDVNAVGGHGYGVLHLLYMELIIGGGRSEECRTKRREALRLLLEAGADINLRDRFGATLLLSLCNPLTCEFAPFPDEIEDVVSLGADPTVAGKQGNTPLHALVSKWNPHVFGLTELLLERGADVRARDRNGRTPLHAACRADVARLLISYGADPEALDNFGLDPLGTRVSEFKGGFAIALLMQYTRDIDASIMRGALQAADGDADAAELKLAGSLWPIMRGVICNLLDPAEPIAPEHRAFVRWLTTTPLGLAMLETVRLEDGDNDSEGSNAASNDIREIKLELLKDDGWERRKHLVCCYVKTREARKGSKNKKISFPSGKRCIVWQDGCRSSPFILTLLFDTIFGPSTIYRQGLFRALVKTTAEVET